MKKIIAVPLSIIIILTSIFSNVYAAPKKQANLLNDTISGVTATVNYETWLEGSYSTMDVTLSNIPSGVGLGNGMYTGWCIQDGISGELRGQQATLYNSLSNTLPSDVSALPWNEINYVLNHKVRGAGKTDLQFAKDVQTALWILTGATNPEFGISAEAQMMVDEAKANPGYTPGNGELFAVIIYYDGFSQTRRDRIQEAIIEVKLTITPTQTATVSPSATGTSPTNTPTGTVTTPTNTSTGTVTPPTNTPTPTGTLAACVPTVVTADFSKVATGASVEGMGVVAPNLNIDAKNTAAKVVENSTPTMYVANKNGISTTNGFVVSGGGFSDITTRNAVQAHSYSFTFAPGVTVGNFSVRMLDFGDANPTNATNHYASLNAYDVNNILIAKQELTYTTPSETLPQSSNLYGNLQVNGDASATPGQPGNWKWNLTATNIVKLTLEFGDGFDPNIAFDSIIFTTDCVQALPPSATPTSTPTATFTTTPNTPTACVPVTTTVDFSNIPIGASVEGMGVAAPNLNIDAKNTAIRIQEFSTPTMYVAAKNGVMVSNGYTVPGKGFSDAETRNAAQPHFYTFTFAPGKSVTKFAVHMLDFGDINPTSSASHYASLTAFNADNIEIGRHELIYTTDAVPYPQSSNIFGNLQVTGDASTQLGMPGNWMWQVSANGITKLVLEFGAGYDPNISFDLISYSTECATESPTPTGTVAPTLTPTLAACIPVVTIVDFSKIPAGASIEGMGTLAPSLNIDGKNTAIKVAEGINPTMYMANKLGLSTANGLLKVGGGFSDAITRNAVQPHAYTFTFAPNISVSNFSLRMLDYGDANPSLATSHYASLSAYDINGVLVGKQELNYTSPAELLPTSSNLYGNLQISGDASAPAGQPGNWIWNISGNSITRLVLEFGAGHDPNIAFDGLTYTTVCP
jgi:hypothetical protein